MRISKEEFCSRLYRLGQFGLSSYQGESDGGKTMRQKILEMVRLAREPMLVLLLLAKKVNLQQKVTTCAKLMRVWLSACLEPSMFVSTPCLDDGNRKALFPQVLAVDPFVKTVEMLKEAGNEDNPELFKIAVQAHDRWAPVNFDPGATRITSPESWESKQEEGHRSPTQCRVFSQVAFGLLAFASSALARLPQLIRLTDDHRLDMIQELILQVAVIVLLHL